MEVLIRNRTIRPSQGGRDFWYNIELSEAEINDLIIIFIDHESKDFREIYWTTGELTKDLDALNFKITGTEDEFIVEWDNASLMTQMK